MNKLIEAVKTAALCSGCATSPVALYMDAKESGGGCLKKNNSPSFITKLVFAAIVLYVSNALALTVSPTSKSFPASGGSSTFQIAYSGGLSFRSPSASHSWIHVKGTSMSTSSSGGTITISYSVDANTQSERSGTISGVVSGTSFSFTVLQECASCSDTCTSFVAFNPNGGVLYGGNFGSANGGSKSATVTLTSGRGSYNAGMRATRSGYTFAGWWTATSGGSQVYDANGRYVSGQYWTNGGVWDYCGALTLYARWTASSEPHTVVFYSNGGVFNSANFGSSNGTSGAASVKVTCGRGSYNAGMRATRSGYTFAGWWTATSGGSQVYDANGRFVPNSRCWSSSGTWQHHSNAVLYARWTTGVEPHAVTFNSNGGCFSGVNFGAKNGASGTATISVTCGKGAYNAGMRATRSGYTFAGWWTATSGGSQVYDANGRFVPNSLCWSSSGTWQHHSNAVLYARWTAASNVKVIFNPNGGYLYSANYATANGSSDAAAISLAMGKGSYNAGMRAVRDGFYKFDGWWTSASGGTQVYSADGRFCAGSYWTDSGAWNHSGAITLYAHWANDTVFHCCATINSKKDSYYYSLTVSGGNYSTSGFVSSASWLAYNGIKIGTSSGSASLGIYYSVAANTSATSRNGTISGLFAQSVTITLHVTQRGMQ